MVSESLECTSLLTNDLNAHVNAHTWTDKLLVNERIVIFESLYTIPGAHGVQVLGELCSRGSV